MLTDFCRESFNESWSKLSWGVHQGGSSRPTPTGVVFIAFFPHSSFALQHLCDWYPCCSQHCAVGPGRDTVKGITAEVHSRMDNKPSGWVHQDHRFQATFQRYCSLGTAAVMVTRRMQREVGILVVILAAWEIRSLTGQGQARGLGHDLAAASHQGRL